MFVSRRPDGGLYGCWTSRQFAGQEEIADDHPDVLGFLAAGMVWDVNAYRPKTAPELAAEKTILADAEIRKAGAAILEAAYACAREDAFWLVIYGFIKDPTKYATPTAFRNALLAATNYPSAAELKQDALQRLIAKL